MSDFFIWAKADKIPYRVFSFLSPLKVLKLNSYDQVKDYFNQIENWLKKGYYACGFISYELGYLFEEKLKPFLKFSSLPLACFGIYKNFNKKYIYPNFSLLDYQVLKQNFYKIKTNITKREYYEAIEKIKNYILRGDTYQVNFTFKIRFNFKGDLENLFYLLLFSQRSKYSFFIKSENTYILSFSPELFLEKRKNIIKSSPMKGTRKRAPLWEEDLKVRKDFKKDTKNQAENIMIVDLLRNDLGRICKEGSVSVSELFKIETYPTLHQMISTIKGNLKTNNLYEILKALFPSGSVTGAPKIRTMEIINELEKEPRGVYTGAIGIIKPNKDFIFNVAIRTLIFKKNFKEAFFIGEGGFGGGIVWDSNPVKEFEEAILKAQFFLSPLPYFALIESFFYEPNKDNPLLLFHFNRLKNSAHYFKFNLPHWLKNFEQFKTFVLEKGKNLNTKKYKARLLLYPDGKFELIFSPFTPWKKNLRIGLVRRNFDLGILFFHKTTFRDPYNLWKKEAEKLGLAEIVFYDERGFLLEGTISNFFIKKDKKYFTPPLELKILNGVMREYMIKTFQAEEKFIKISDLNFAEELYIGNAVRGLGKVSEWIIL